MNREMLRSRKLAARPSNSPTKAIAVLQALGRVIVVVLTVNTSRLACQGDVPFDRTRTEESLVDANTDVHDDKTPICPQSEELPAHIHMVRSQTAWSDLQSEQLSTAS